MIESKLVLKAKISIEFEARSMGFEIFPLKSYNKIIPFDYKTQLNASNEL